MRERRKHPRIALRAEDLPIMFVQDDRRRRIPLTAVNLSLAGVGFLCTQRFDLDEELETMILLPNSSPVCCPGVIRFKREVWGLHGYGMELTIDEQGQELLGRYLSNITHGV